MLKKILLITLLAAWVIPAYADKNRVDPSELDFGTNLETPEVPARCAHDIREHMKAIKAVLERHQLTVEMDRDGEVIDIIIPCAELFKPNETEITQKGAAKLRLLTDILGVPTMYKVLIAVYSDNTGEPEYCDSLTMLRANAIDDYLIALAGNSNINVVPYGMGQDDPRVENNSIENRARNRRVEIFIVPEWQMIDTAKVGKLKPRSAN